MHVDFIFLALFLIVTINVKEQCASAEFNIFPFGPVVIPSELHPLNSVATLRCALTLSPGVDYESQWTGPGDVGVINPAMSDRYTVFHTTYESQNEADPDWSGTKLLIHKLSYQDAGLYTCSGRRRMESKLASSWVAATINLQLDLDLSSKFNETIVTATTSDSAVKLSCEMSAFIRPDNFLMWEGPDNQVLTSGTGKYQITFSNGSRDTAVDGSGTLVPSRVSTLTISNPAKSDQGVYTCSVMGTNKTVDLVIMINDVKTSPATTASVDNNTETKVTLPDVTTGLGTVDKVTNPQLGDEGTTQTVQSGNNSSKNYMNTAAMLFVVIVSTGALI